MRPIDAPVERTAVSAEQMAERIAEDQAWAANHAREEAEKEAVLKAEMVARDEQRAADHAAEQARMEIRSAAEQAEADRRRAEIAARRAEYATSRAAAEAWWAEYERQDEDYQVSEIRLDFEFESVGAEGHRAEYDFSDSDTWELSEEAFGALPITELKAEVVRAIEPWVTHYRSLGLIRADLVTYIDDSKPGDGLTEPKFFLVRRAADADLLPETLGQFEPVKIDLRTLPGASLTLYPGAVATNATRCYSAAQRGALGVGQWGGEATPDLAPRADETRDDWLERVCMPTTSLKRWVSWWRRSGGKLELYKAAGAASAYVARDRPIRWIVSGLIPRGYVTLLAAAKQAGKSTLLGELLAVVDSECQSPRYFLGTEITERGVGCMVSGEDGIDFVSSRNAYYEQVHGEAQGFVFVTAERPWADVLKLLYEIPKLDILCIDGLRAVMPGNEDSSDAITQFFDELNALAQFHDCAIVLVHHLSKGVVRHLSAMLPAVRGSGAITDRVRIAIGMIDRGSDVTELGIIKCNVPPSETMWGEVNAGRLFRRDAATLTLVPVDAVKHTAGASTDNSSALAAVFAALESQNRLNVVLRRTGKHELFERKLPQLAGMSRSTIRDGVSALIEAGRIADGPDGLLAIRPGEAEAVE
jgi:AAA domain